MKIKLHIDKESFNKKPTGGEIGGIKARLQNSAVPAYVTIKQLKSKIEIGCSISPAVMTGRGAASEELWRATAVCVTSDTAVL